VIRPCLTDGTGRLTGIDLDDLFVTSTSRALALVLTAWLGACGHSRTADPQAYPVLSPNGETLSGGPLGRVNCRNAMAHWFDRVDSDHDGKVTLGEFTADAQSQFAVMDLDKDGIVTPAELAAYRAPYMPSQPAERTVRAEERSRPAGEARPGSNQRAARPGIRQRSTSLPDTDTDRPDPVMAADVGLRNKISLDDFVAYAKRHFAALDIRHHSALSREDVQQSCGSSDR